MTDQELPRKNQNSDQETHQSDRVVRSRGNDLHFSDLIVLDLITGGSKGERPRRAERDRIDGLDRRHHSPPLFDGLEPVPTEASSNQRRRMAISGQWQQQDGRTARPAAI